MLFFFIFYITSYLTPLEKDEIVKQCSHETIRIFEMIENVEREVRESDDEFIMMMKQQLIQNLVTVQKRIYLQVILIKE